MNIAFTLCSNNYFAQAKTTAESFLKHHPDFLFVIGVVDKQSDQINYHFNEKVSVYFVEELMIDGFDEMLSKYDIIELNTAVKPKYFEYLFKSVSNPNIVIYIDPDTYVYETFTEVVNNQECPLLILTPHMLSPIEDKYLPTDYSFLRFGVFNLGFLAVFRHTNTTAFLNWWHSRVVKFGFNNADQGMFYDQLWMNYAPCFFEDCIILKHPGYNMANWNLHERDLTFENSKHTVNGKFDLKFFHFSHYSYSHPAMISKHQTRFSLENRKDLSKIFGNYNLKLLSNNIENYSKIECAFFYKLKTMEKKKLDLHGIIQGLKYRTSTALKVLLKGHA